MSSTLFALSLTLSLTMAGILELADIVVASLQSFGRYERNT
jgi:hypothetical protein